MQKVFGATLAVVSLLVVTWVPALAVPVSGSALKQPVAPPLIAFTHIYRNRFGYSRGYGPEHSLNRYRHGYRTMCRSPNPHQRARCSTY